MPAFSVELMAAIREQRAGVRTLVEMQFLSRTDRVHFGFGDIVAGGHIWSGIGDIVSISSLDQTTQGEAGVATFTLSGVSPQLFATANSENGAEYRQRPITVYLQFFDSVTLAAIETPKAVWAGLMDQMKLSSAVVEAESAKSRVRAITLTAETIFQDRARPPYGSYSDADQKARFPGDLGCGLVATLVKKTLAWPVT